MAKTLTVRYTDNQYVFTFKNGDTREEFNFNFEEVSALDTLLGQLRTIGLLIKNPTFPYLELSIDLEKMVEKVDSAIPGFFRDKSGNSFNPGGYR